jgi:hypothetical protein
MDSTLLVNLIAFALLTLLWLAFGAALLFNRGLLDQAWQRFRSWPLLVQLVVGLLTLPVVAGLWVWETTWPAWLRLALVIGLAWVTVYTFFPAAWLA